MSSKFPVATERIFLGLSGWQELPDGVAAVSSVPPDSPDPDALWYDKTVELLKRWDSDSSTWQPSGKATYAALTAVAVAPSSGHVKTYDPLRCLYNAKPSNLRRLRTALARARAGTGLANITFVGDSKTAGQGSTNPATDAWPIRLRSILAANGYPVAGDGLTIGAGANSSALDPRWALTGTWTAAAQDKPGLFSTQVGATATYTSLQAGTIVEFFTIGTGGAFTYQIDGGSIVTPTLSGTNALQFFQVTGLANTTHTIKFTNSTSTGAFITAVDVRGTAGLLFHNLGNPGSKTSDWKSVAAYQNSALSLAVTTDATFISLLINDARNSVAAATSQTNLTAIANDHLGLGRDVVLVVPTPGAITSVPKATWDQYVSAIYSVADSLDLPLIDLGDRMGTWESANTAGLFFDGFHENTQGYALDANCVANIAA